MPLFSAALQTNSAKQSCLFGLTVILQSFTPHGVLPACPMYVCMYTYIVFNIFGVWLIFHHGDRNSDHNNDHSKKRMWHILPGKHRHGQKQAVETKFIQPQKKKKPAHGTAHEQQQQHAKIKKLLTQ